MHLLESLLHYFTAARYICQLSNTQPPSKETPDKKSQAYNNYTVIELWGTYCPKLCAWSVPETPPLIGNKPVNSSKATARRL